MRDMTNKQNMMTYSLNLMHACSITEHTERPLMRLKKNYSQYEYYKDIY